MQKPSKLAQIPQIRFAGFTEDWERRKFGELAVKESNCDISSIDMPCVEYEDVIANEGQLNKDISLKEMQKKGIIFDGSQVLFGKLRPYLHNWLNPDFKGVAVGDWWVLRPIELDKNFLYRLIQTQQFDDIANQSAGSKMPRADWNLIAETEFIVPNLIEEQNKIGELFANLDKLITLHQSKFEKLQKIKKSCLQNLFPQNNQNTPKIRFKNFSDEWVESRLGELGETYSGLSGKTKNDFGRGNAKYITYLNVFSNSIADIKLTEPIEKDEKQNQVKFGDVLFTTSSETPNEVGMSSVWLGNFQNCYLNSFCFGYRLTQKINHYYLAYLLRSENIRNEIILLAQGISRYNISKNKMMDISISIPNSEEQEKIGAFFSKLDKLITLQQRKVEKLKNIKKALLNKMLI